MPAPKEKQTFYSVVIGENIHSITGRKRTPHGYVTLCIKTHPHAAENGYIFEHRIVMEMILKRYLNNNEIVHHKNEIRHDNRIENLEVMNHADHIILHHTGSKRTKETKLKISEKARNRLKNKSNHPSYKDIAKDHLVAVLKNNGPKKTAEILGVTRKTVYNKIKEFNLEEWYSNVK